MSRSIRVSAPAKVNLTLEVVGKRADGYHELRSIFARVCDLADDVRVAAARTLDVRYSPPLDTDDDLASRAVRAVARASGREPRAFVRIRKRIPIAAGLAGGSSDAAAVACAISELWRVPVPDVAESLGSDVPFFMAGTPVALVEGRGERVFALPRTEMWIVLVAPVARLSTARVFAELRREEWSDGTASRALATDVLTPAAIRENARNDLLAAAERCEPRIRDVRERARRARIALHLSGSGPSLFAIADDRADARRIARALQRIGIRARPLRVG